MTDDLELERLASEARYRRERYELYQAKSYGMRPTSPRRLEELRRESESAQARLVAARRRQATTSPGPGAA